MAHVTGDTLLKLTSAPQGVADANAVECYTSDGPVDYISAVAAMEAHVAAILAGTAKEAIWFLEHPPLYTAGTSARPEDLIAPVRFPVHKAGRGGQFTYHGPGQRVAYVMLDVKARYGDVRGFVSALEAWIIQALAQVGVEATVRPGRVGVWVPRQDDPLRRDDKIAAIGIRLRRWVSFHGISVNVHPDLSHFDGIVPCGIADHGVTSLAALGRDVSMIEFDGALRSAFRETFGTPTVNAGGDLLRNEKSAHPTGTASHPATGG